MAGMWLLLGGMLCLYGAFWQWQFGAGPEPGLAGAGVLLAAWGLAALVPGLRAWPGRDRRWLAVAAAGSAWLVAVLLWSAATRAGTLAGLGAVVWSAVRGEAPVWPAVQALAGGVWVVTGAPHVEVLRAAGDAGAWAAAALGVPALAAGAVWVLVWMTLILAPVCVWQPWAWWWPRGAARALGGLSRRVPEVSPWRALRPAAVAAVGAPALAVAGTAGAAAGGTEVTVFPAAVSPWVALAVGVVIGAAGLLVAQAAWRSIRPVAAQRALGWVRRCEQTLRRQARQGQAGGRRSRVRKSREQPEAPVMAGAGFEQQGYLQEAELRH